MMTDIDLALKYGGFTSLDQGYLAYHLAQLTPEEARRWLTPPPSVINAYFVELYQKQSPQKATDYYLELSQAFKLFQSTPRFSEEVFPFVRLNLSGKAYGFAYESADEVAHVFGQEDYPVTTETLVELAQIFPHYMIYHQKEIIKMSPVGFEDVAWTDELDPDYPLTSIATSGNLVRIKSYNIEEALEVSKRYHGQSYFQWQERQLIITIES